MQVDRQGGSITDDQGTDSTYTITVFGSHPMDQDMMDRTLQFVLVELGIDTTWADVPPPDPEVVPPPADPGDPDQQPQYVDENGEVQPLSTGATSGS
jgi:hypothetical protein